MERKLKVEFLLPISYNDGNLVEGEKLVEVRQELINRFSGWSQPRVVIDGSWIDTDGTSYKDESIKFEVVILDTSENRLWLKAYKETLKIRFGQKDIYMIFTEIFHV